MAGKTGAMHWPEIPMNEHAKILGVLTPGQDFDGLKLIRQLNAGGQGGVILAEQAGGYGTVAVKVVFKHNADSLRHFEREKEILSKIDIARTATILSHGEYAGKLPYMVLDFIPGTGLDQFADERRMPVDQRCELFATACDIVEALHRSGIVHCDLKPSNFLVTADGRVTLIDFGSAFRIGRKEDGGVGGDNPGTEAYMSPEQMRGEALDERTDVYSLGVMLYELVSGYLPFTQEHDVRTATQAAHRQAPSDAIFRTGRINRGGDIYPMDPAEIATSRSTQPEELASVLRAGLDAVILKAVRPEQGDRFQSIAALSDAVKKCLK